MRPVTVAISSNDTALLRDECTRLGIAVSIRTHAATLRRLLRTHAQNYALWQKWCALAELLFGSNHGCDTSTHDTVIDAVHDRLYERLVAEGMVAAHTFLVDSQRQIFLVIGRQNTRVVNARIFRRGRPEPSDNMTIGESGAYSILMVARCAFPDVAETVTAWESNKNAV